MTHEEKLNSVLSFIISKDNNAHISDFKELKYGDEIKPLIRQLREHKYLGDGLGGNSKYHVTPAGKMFLEDGGYLGQKHREARARAINEETLAWTKYATYAAIVAAVLSLFALLK